MRSSTIFILNLHWWDVRWKLVWAHFMQLTDFSAKLFVIFLSTYLSPDFESSRSVVNPIRLLHFYTPDFYPFMSNTFKGASLLTPRFEFRFFHLQARMVFIGSGLCIYIVSHQRKCCEILCHFVVWPSFFVNTKELPKNTKEIMTVHQFCFHLLLAGPINLIPLPECFFHRHPYWPHFIEYGNLAIWPYGHILTIWPIGHLAIWP